MTGWHGPYHRGAMREHRQRLRADAEKRDRLTPMKKRREWRVAQEKRQKRPKKAPGQATAPAATEAA